MQSVQYLWCRHCRSDSHLISISLSTNTPAHRIQSNFKISAMALPARMPKHTGSSWNKQLEQVIQWCEKGESELLDHVKHFKLEKFLEWKRLLTFDPTKSLHLEFTCELGQPVRLFEFNLKFALEFWLQNDCQNDCGALKLDLLHAMRAKSFNSKPNSLQFCNDS